jgi:hypothetical protein
LVEINCQSFFVGHLPKVGNIGRNNRDSESTRKMGDATGAGGRRIRHYRDASGSKELWNCFFGYVSGEFHAWIIFEALGHRGNITWSSGMVAPSHHQLHVGQAFGNQIKGLDHRLQPFVRSPFAKSQKAVGRITTSREVRILGEVGQDSVGTNAHVSPAVLLQQDLAICWHENGYGIGHQQHSGCEATCRAVKAREAHTRIFQIDGIHKMMQGHMCVTAEKTGQQWGG